MKRHRTSFPSHIDFDGWWVKSRKGCVGQLVRDGRNLHEQNLYSLRYSNGQIGHGLFTTEQLVECCVSIRFSKEDLDDNDKPAAAPPRRRTIVR